MTLKIRFRQSGRKNRLFYRLVITDTRSPRDGKYVEALGWYNPCARDENRLVLINEERIQHWLDQGAQLSEKALALVAKVAPAVVQKLKEKELAQRAKTTAKRRERRRAKAAA